MNPALWYAKMGNTKMSNQRGIHSLYFGRKMSAIVEHTISAAAVSVP